MSESELKYNTLIISDIHLGEDLKPSAKEADHLHLDMVEKQLCHFIDYHARRREDGMPWRLVINGDMIDFMTIAVFPDHPNFEGRENTPDERLFGFARTPKVAEAIMDMVGERHFEVFRSMARFLSRGNRIEIISGNHDTELHWPTTQAKIRQIVARAWDSLPDSTKPDAPNKNDIEKLIGFHPWFFHEPGVLWIEHGHQYDECCSFEHQLYPRRPKSDQIVTNVDTAGIKFVSNFAPESDPNIENWSAFGYLRFALGLGLKGASKLAKGYYMFSKTLLKVWRAGAKRSVDLGVVADGHRQRMQALSQVWELPMSTLEGLDDLRHSPVVGNLARLSRVLMLDKLLFFSLAIVAAFMSVMFFEGFFALSGSIAAFVLATLATMWSATKRNVSPQHSLLLTPERILNQIDAQYVVFGHTHEPVRASLGEKGTYFNTGTWVPTGKPGLLRAFTHVVIKHQGPNVVAELCQWRDGASRVFKSDPRDRVILAQPEKEIVESRNVMRAKAS